MSRFRKWMTAVLVLQFLLVAVCSLIFIRFTNNSGDRMYRVEAGRVEKQLKEGGLSSVSLSDYQTIIEVTPFDGASACGHDCVIAEADGVWYRICYQAGNAKTGRFLFPGLGLVLWLSTAWILWYIRRSVLKPFDSMTQMTAELAKGNLSVPVREEKSRFFGKFLWGVDMLREKLESSRQRDLEYQKEKKTLILSLSHDIKTPLSAISLYVKALQNHLYETEKEKEEAYDGIVRNAGEIERYVEQITKASREDFLHLEVKNGEFYLNDVMDSILLYYRGKMQLSHIDFTVGPFSNLLLKGDRDRVIEILQNVLENAMKYGDGREAGIFFDREEDCCLIRVENTGSPVREEELGNLFDSFYRGSNAEGVQGSGLGLYICRQLIRKMGGEIYAAQESDRFTVTVVIRMA